MEAIIQTTQARMKRSVQALVEEFKVIRTGRATPSLLDRIMINYYGTQTPINQVATISTPETRLLVIQPWDRAVLGDIEKAILSSELSLNPSNDGKLIRLQVPPLTKERRMEYVKIAHSTAEKMRVSIRNVRREANDELKKSVKSGDISEDEERRAGNEVQKLTDRFIGEIDEILKAKEQDILEI